MRYAIIAVAAAALAVAGCGHSNASPGEKASASAAASRLAHDPAVVKAKAAWEPTVKRCAGQQHWVLHPFKAVKGTVTCATAGLAPAQRKAVEKCASTVIIANGVGTGKLAKDETGIALCLAKAAPDGPGK